MPIRIAHLSDIHFGRRFDFALWRAVKHEVTRFQPHLLIVSGDVVDDPHPIQLLAAKSELTRFAEGIEAELVVVPGNHDVFAGGLYTLVSPRRAWFDRIFFNDTKEAEDAAAAEFGEPLGFSRTFLSTAPPNSKVLTKLWRRFLGPGAFAKHIPADGKQDLVRRPARCGVLLALLDSNVPGQPIGFATGQVAESDLLALTESLSGVGDAYLSRICVVHHHVLPIAFSGGKIVGAEPLMVLHNAGTMLALMARHRFDLVLHGHKHVAQFARLDLSPLDEDGYPIAVAAAGSAALRSSGRPRDNCFNFITISQNGRIEVDSLFYGDANDPSWNRQSGACVHYAEPISVVKRRAHFRALERHPIRCESRTMDFEVTETGDLLCDLSIENLQSERPDPPKRREHSIALAEDGWLVENLLGLDMSKSSPGTTFVLRPADPGAVPRKGVVRKFDVTVPEDQLRRGKARYRASWACANSVNMTRWECEQRTPLAERTQGWEDNWVGLRIPHPIETLTITLRLPPSLADARPELICERFGAFPSYGVNGAGDVDVGAGGDWTVDGEIMEHEAACFRSQPEDRLWRLEVTKPMVGYSYRIKWQAPADKPVKQVQAAVSEHRDTLLRAISATGTMPEGVSKVFSVLADTLDKLFAQKLGDSEKRSVDLFVYDSRCVALRPVLNWRSWTQKPIRADFEIPLGQGIAGAAFQQGRIVPWALTVTESPFVKPYPYEEKDDEPSVEFRSIIAFPVFHLSRIGDQRPPLWSCLGVVCFGSSSEATAIPGLMEAKSDSKLMDDLRLARAIAHASVDEILRLL